MLTDALYEFRWVVGFYDEVVSAYLGDHLVFIGTGALGYGGNEEDDGVFKAGRGADTGAEIKPVEIFCAGEHDIEENDIRLQGLYAFKDAIGTGFCDDVVTCVAEDDTKYIELLFVVFDYVNQFLLGFGHDVSPGSCVVGKVYGLL